jgi:hypothetical protein
MMWDCSAGIIAGDAVWRFLNDGVELEDPMMSLANINSLLNTTKYYITSNHFLNPIERLLLNPQNPRHHVFQS